MVLKIRCTKVAFNQCKLYDSITQNFYQADIFKIGPAKKDAANNILKYVGPWVYHAVSRHVLTQINKTLVVVSSQYYNLYTR